MSVVICATLRRKGLLNWLSNGGRRSICLTFIVFFDPLTALSTLSGGAALNPTGRVRGKRTK